MDPPVLARIGAVLKRTAALLLLLLMVRAAPPAWADTAVMWNLVDADGQRLAALLFKQPDPAYPPGLRLRLNARSSGLAFDHHRPLQLMDSRGGIHSLINRSAELVAPGTPTWPDGSAQFELAGLSPLPDGSTALRLTVSTTAGDRLFAAGPPQT
jgi:hypothetical protein